MKNVQRFRRYYRNALSPLLLMGLVVMCVLAAPLAAAAHTKLAEIKGTVKDSKGEALIGASINVKGKTAGAMADANGNFSIQAESNDILVVSYVGYISQEVPVNGRSVIDVVLLENQSLLEEVVVVGYGTQKKADLTGAIGQIKTDEIMKQPATSAMQSIQGKIAGATIIANEAPGSSPTVLIRGMGTALGGRNPLYVVDGMPVDNINNIHPNDIQSMDILKDASSASIYGLRAANGVVIVTTKKGKAGKTQVSYDGYMGVKGILNRVEMADAQQYITYFNENLDNIAAANQTWRLKTNQANNTNWYDELLQKGQQMSHSVNLSGGSENVDFFVSYNNLTEEGILKGAKYQRNTLRNNNQYRFFKGRLKLNQTLNFTFTEAEPKSFGLFNDAYRQSPLVPVWYANGRAGRTVWNRTTGIVGYERNPGETVGNLNSIGNPVYSLMQQRELLNTNTLQGGFDAEVKITDYLKFNSRVGATRYGSRSRNFTDVRNNWLNADPIRTEAEFNTLKAANPTTTAYANNSFSYSTSESFRWVWENFATFNKSFGKHNVEATAGFSREKVGIGSGINGTGYDVPEQEQYWNINLGTGQYQKTIGQTYYTPRALASYFARAQYNFNSTYYLTATIRRDGSSVFKNNEEYWGTFPAVGAGWTVSNESFMQDSFLDYLKIRANWGKLGNQDIPLNVSQILTAAGSSNRNYVFGAGQELVFGAVYGTPAVDVSWEVTTETGIGADFALLKDRLSGSIDYYHKLNTNAILLVTPTFTSAYENNFYAHGAKVLNSGIELGLNWSDKSNIGLNYSFGVNYAYNNNVVKEVTPAYDGQTGGSLGNGQITKQLREGQPIYAWWMYEAKGVWQTKEEIAAGVKLGTPRPGHLVYADQNSDKAIDNLDKVFFGSYLPKHTYGVNVNMDYKNIDLSIHGYGVGGNQIYNGLKGTRIDGGENVPLDLFEKRWHGAGTSTVHPGADRDSYASSYYLEPGGFFRINNITLGYTLNKLYSGSSKLRIYATAQNPLMFTKYTGFSPEIADNGDPSGTSGVELSAYPTTRNFILGLNLQF